MVLSDTDLNDLAQDITQNVLDIFLEYKIRSEEDGELYIQDYAILYNLILSVCSSYKRLKPN